MLTGLRSSSIERSLIVKLHLPLLLISCHPSSSFKANTWPRIPLLQHGPCNFDKAASFSRYESQAHHLLP